MKEKAKALKTWFVVDTGGKKSVHLKRAGTTGVSLVLTSALVSAIFSRPNDKTFFIQTTASEKLVAAPQELGSNVDKQVQGLLSNGSKQLADEKRSEEARRRSVISIKYFAPQLVGLSDKGAKAIRTGAKLLGFLMGAIDTREPSLVRVVLPHGGVSSAGVEIEKGSILVGQFSYRGEGEKIWLSFSRLDTPDGDSIKISAQALDAADYTAGVRGKVYSDAGLKIASTLGLTMAASMTDVMTEREALGSAGTATAKPTMKNALLQGTSKAAQDQASRTSEEINGAQDYVVVPEGKEIIIQLTQDFKK